MNPSEKNACCEEAPKRAWYRNKVLLISLVAALLYGGGFLFPFLRPFQAPFSMYLRMIWWALAVGFGLAGLVDRYVPAEYVSHLLAGRRKRTIFLATGLGLLMSACSHGILAIGMELHKKGASGPAVISFLLGSPWANLPVTILLISLFHAKGLLIIASALFVSITTGFAFLGLDRLGWIDKNPHTTEMDANFLVWEEIQKRWRGKKWNVETIRQDARAVWQGAVDVANMVLWWILLGIVLAGLIGAYVPSDIFHRYLGPTFLGLLATLGAATVIEICSEGSAPLAFEIYRQTGSIGNTFTFLMGGFVTDYTEIGLIWQNIGWRTSVWMVAVTVPQVLLLGYLYNHLFYP